MGWLKQTIEGMFNNVVPRLFSDRDAERIARIALRTVTEWPADSRPGKVNLPGLMVITGETNFRWPMNDHPEWIQFTEPAMPLVVDRHFCANNFPAFQSMVNIDNSRPASLEIMAVPLTKIGIAVAVGALAGKTNVVLNDDALTGADVNNIQVKLAALGNAANIGKGLCIVLPGKLEFEVAQFLQYMEEVANAASKDRKVPAFYFSSYDTQNHQSLGRLSGVIESALENGFERVVLCDATGRILDDRLVGLRKEATADQIESIPGQILEVLLEKRDQEPSIERLEELAVIMQDCAAYFKDRGVSPDVLEMVNAQIAGLDQLIANKERAGSNPGLGETDLDTGAAKGLMASGVRTTQGRALVVEKFYQEVVKPALWENRKNQESGRAEIATNDAIPPLPTVEPRLDSELTGGGTDSPSWTVPSATPAIPSIHFIVGPPGAIIGPAISTATTALFEQNLSGQNGSPIFQQAPNLVPISLSRDDLHRHYQDFCRATGRSSEPEEAQTMISHCFRRALADIAKEKLSAVVDLSGVPPQEIPQLVQPLAAQGVAVTVAIQRAHPDQIIQADNCHYLQNLRAQQTSVEGIPPPPFRITPVQDPTVLRQLQTTITALAAAQPATEPIIDLTFVDATGALQKVPRNILPNTAQLDLPQPETLDTKTNPNLRATLIDPSACQSLLQALQQVPLSPGEQAQLSQTWQFLAFTLDRENAPATPDPIRRGVHHHTAKSAEQVGRNPEAQVAYIAQQGGEAAALDQSKATITYLLRGRVTLNGPTSSSPTQDSLPLSRQDTELTPADIKTKTLLAVGPLHAAVKTEQGAYGLVALRALQEQGIELPAIGQMFNGPSRAKSGAEQGLRR